MANTDLSPTYMLPRDQLEIDRLEFQHTFLRNLTYDRLLHPSIPLQSVHRIADVGTGTGIWLQEVAASLPLCKTPANCPHVGFDITGAQFPSNTAITRFEVHDCVSPFPDAYHETFDVVHVRLLSYALKVHDVRLAVENIVRLLRPGGYLHWQEADTQDVWATPETASVKKRFAFSIADRVARGLTPAIITPLLRTILTLSPTPLPIPKTVNAISFDPEAQMRLFHLETVSTHEHPSDFVQKHKSLYLLRTSQSLLRAGAMRLREIAKNAETSSAKGKSEFARLIAEAEQREELVAMVDTGEDLEGCEWDFEMTWIVARKAAFLPERDAWISMRHPEIGQGSDRDV